MSAILAILVIATGAASAEGGSESSSPARAASSNLLPSSRAAFEKLAAAGFEVPSRELISTDFTLELLGGGPEMLTSYRGSLVLLNFWAT